MAGNQTQLSTYCQLTAVAVLLMLQTAVISGAPLSQRHQRQAENQADNSTAEFVPLLLSLQISFRLCTGGRCTILANRLHQEGQLPPPV